MLDSLFNMELPTLVKAVIAFAIVLALLGLVAWLFRRFGGARVGAPAARGRQPRLAVIDAAAVDSRRRLVLIRRDNVEHLVMIGGPTDVLIEQNIVRAVPVAPQREAPMQREIPMPREAPPREPPPPRMPEDIGPRGEPPRVHAEARPPRAELPVRPPRGDLSARRPPPDFDRNREAPRPRPAPPEFARGPRLEEPRLEPGAPAVGALQPDASLSDMAHKLEAALRRPGSRPEPDFAPPPPPTLAEAPPPTAPDLAGNGHGPAAPPVAPPVRAEPPAAPKGKSEPKPGKSMFDSLEEEMQSLLGKPPEMPENK